MAAGIRDEWIELKKFKVSLLLIFISLQAFGLEFYISGGPTLPLFSLSGIVEPGWEFEGRLPFWKNDLLTFDIGVSHAVMRSKYYDDFTFTLTSFSPGLKYGIFRGFIFALSPYARLGVISEDIKWETGSKGKTFIGIHLGALFRYYYTEKLNLTLDASFFLTDEVYTFSLRAGIVLDI